MPFDPDATIQDPRQFVPTTLPGQQPVIYPPQQVFSPEPASPQQIIIHQPLGGGFGSALRQGVGFGLGFGCIAPAVGCFAMLLLSGLIVKGCFNAVVGGHSGASLPEPPRAAPGTAPRGPSFPELAAALENPQSTDYQRSAYLNTNLGKLIRASGTVVNIRPRDTADPPQLELTCEVNGKKVRLLADMGFRANGLERLQRGGGAVVEGELAEPVSGLWGDIYHLTNAYLPGY